MPRRRPDEDAPVAHRTARIVLRVTPAQDRRCRAMLVAGGDVWAALIELNSYRLRRRARPIFNYQELCREVAGVRVGELSTAALRSVLRRYADGCMHSAARKRRGERARYPRRRRSQVPLRYYAGTFALDGRRLRLSTASGAPPLSLRLSRDVPYPAEQVRSVTLQTDNGRLVVDVTAEVPIAVAPGTAIAGVDVGIIHPFALASGARALVISGRAARAEERLHLADTKARQRVRSRAKKGSRRWRTLRAAQRKAEHRHRRRVHQMHHEAAKGVVAWAQALGVGTLVVGDPKGITQRHAGRVQNRRVSNTWRRTHLVSALRHKAQLAGIGVEQVDERQTSSTCPDCGERTPKPKGRTFTCPHCGHVGHRDIVGARNIAARGGGSTTAPAVVTHRRAGRPPARRDRRRHLMDVRRSCPAPGRPVIDGESLVGTPAPHTESDRVGNSPRRGSDDANVV